nr:pentatricopeptide repeat protein AaPPR12 [Agave angustifolia]
MLYHSTTNYRKLLHKIPKPLPRSKLYTTQPQFEQDQLITSLLQKCPNMRILRQVHAYVLKRPSPASHYALTRILAFSAAPPSGDIVYARRLFVRMPHPNIFTWNSMIRGCSLIQNPTREPISLYKQLVQLGFPTPNSFTVAFVLKACSTILAFFEGRQIHSHAYKYGLDSSPFVQTGLLNFYAKCEEIMMAGLVFDEITDKNLIAWSAII